MLFIISLKKKQIQKQSYDYNCVLLLYDWTLLSWLHVIYIWNIDRCSKPLWSTDSCTWSRQIKLPEQWECYFAYEMSCACKSLYEKCDATTPSLCKCIWLAAWADWSSLSPGPGMLLTAQCLSEEHNYVTNFSQTHHTVFVITYLTSPLTVNVIGGIL